MAESPDLRVPLTIVSGFLGSGKTTLLREILTRPEMARTLILVNEVAEVGVDQRLLRPFEESVVLLENGCICCTVMDGLQRVLLEIAELGPQAKSIERIVVETTGLADPRAMIGTIVGTPMVTSAIRLNGIITLVDCLHAAHEFETYPEFTGQIVAADRVVLTKEDRAETSLIRATHGLVAGLNPAARLISRTDLHGIVHFLAGNGTATELLALRAEPTLRSFGRNPGGRRRSFHCERSGIRTFAVELDRACDWTVFATWLSLLLHAHGERILRVKGIINLFDGGAPVAINTVQHLLYFPEHLQDWPDGDRSSVLVFIVRDLSPDLIIGSMQSFLGMGRSADGC